MKFSPNRRVGWMRRPITSKLSIALTWGGNGEIYNN